MALQASSKLSIKVAPEVEDEDEDEDAGEQNNGGSDEEDEDDNEKARKAANRKGKEAVSELDTSDRDDSDVNMRAPTAATHAWATSFSALRFAANLPKERNQMPRLGRQWS